LLFIRFSPPRRELRVKFNQGTPLNLKNGLFCFVAAAALVLPSIAPSANRPDGSKADVKSSTAGAVGVHQLAQAVDEHYNHLRSLEAGFTEIYRGTGAEREESGTLLLKKPRKMRWEYRSPRVKLFISDGQSVWFYLPAERQLRKTDLKRLDDLRSPIAFLLGKTKLEKELQGLSRAVDQAPESPGDTVLRGVPRAMEDQVSEVKLEVTPAHEIARIVLVEPDGASTEFRFSGWKENLGVADSQFHFVPPAGVEVVEGSFGP
jgi:outer membrane lipoprotein carrier protein